MSQAQSDQNLLYATVEISVDLAGIEAQDTISLSFQPSVADRISRETFGFEVKFSIDFHYQTSRMYREIRDVGTDRHLFSRVNPIKLSE